MGVEVIEISENWDREPTSVPLRETDVQKMSQERLISAIIRSGLIFPCVVIVAGELWIISLFHHFFMLLNRGEPLRKEWMKMVLTLLISAALFLPMLQTLCFTVFLPGEAENDPIQRSGKVEDRAQALYMARYGSPEHDVFLRAYTVLVDGTQYFCLGGDQMECGSRISFLCYPKSRVIVSFQEEAGENRVEQKTDGRRYSELGVNELLLYAVGLLFGIGIGFLASLVAAKKSMPKDICWIRGEFFYRNGIDLAILTAILTGIAVLLIPALRKITYGELLIPSLLVLLCREIPRSYALDEQTLSVYLFGTIRVQSVTTAAVKRSYLFHTENGSLFVLDQSENDLLSCRTLFDFLGYCRRNRKHLLFLPVAEANLDYARSEFTNCLGSPLKKTGLISTFPLKHE